MLFSATNVKFALSETQSVEGQVCRHLGSSLFYLVFLFSFT